MMRFATLVTTLAAAGIAACTTAATGPAQNAKDAPTASQAQPGSSCRAPSSDDALIGKSEQEATALLAGCLWRVSERDGKALPGTMDYREERRNLGIQGLSLIHI